MELYTLKESMPIAVNQLKGYCVDNRLWCLRNGILTIKAPFSWDGCTPKFKLFGRVFGTWDGSIKTSDGGISPKHKPELWLASMVHDALYIDQSNVLSRKQVDRLFLWLMRKENFRFALLYYLVVRLVGWLWWYKIL